MNIPRERLDYLFHQYMNGQASQAEQVELQEWLAEVKEDAPLREYLAARWQDWQAETPEKQPDWDLMLQQIVSTPVQRRKRFLWKQLAAACVLLFLLGGVIFYYYNGHHFGNTISSAAAVKNDVPPGTTKAVLTLADGSKILLDSAVNGRVAEQGNTQVVKQANGQISYRNTSSNSSLPNSSLYNTLTTGRGEQSPPVTLSDGTKVWLNAASSIRFPVAFTGGLRTVEITGEAYFEVAHLSLAGGGKATLFPGRDNIHSSPFIVKINTPSGGGGEVQVLGTHFNIMAYPDEKTVNTTLLEGAVVFRQGNTSKKLVPGEQAVLEKDKAAITVSPTDVEIAVAWKNGLFRFDRSDIQTIMRQISRWYNVNISYAGAVPNRSFYGGIDRNLPLSSILKVLEKNNIRFRVEGNNIMVLP
jgi:ferric-dicitrate binding protein FerR (iron transport regulator)